MKNKRKGKEAELDSERNRPRRFLIAVFAAACWSPASAVVFINEVAINPPGSLDDFREYVELCGTPGKKLDGYALVLLSGSEQKYYPLNSIPPLPNPRPEIDEFFSLDGLSLGANGLLVLAIATIDNYPEVLPETNFVGPWIDLWNGGLDVPGRFQNDGSNTILLIRNRPGRTEADPTNAGGLRWAKSLFHDAQRIRPALDPQDNTLKDQWGDGDLDFGQHNGINGPTLDFLGVTTPQFDDDLEIVDEVSYESERGWEYDFDDRHVDSGSVVAGLPERRVHALDDPQGFNPDNLTRVDYRTSGVGWTPAAGATGEMTNGNNWQDTATEQWIRGEALAVFTPTGPEIYYSNAANANPDAIQPYSTQVPRWLNDGVGTNFNFAAANSYRVMAGRTNALAVPFIPGDADRDGDCDLNDVAKIAAVFGDDDWLFINSYSDAPEGNDGDPGEQTLPWDVDATGDNGIEASDLQWTLNFLGNANGQIVGRRYDSTTPASNGVFLNSPGGTGCTVTWAAHVPSGRAITDLAANDLVEITVLAQVTSGARTSPIAQTNGIMQFVHDLTIASGGVVRVESVEGLAPFSITRSALIAPNGATDLGVRTINGHTTVYTHGLGSAGAMYRVILKAVSPGLTQINLSPAVHANFASSTPRGLKLGRTDQNGNPAGAIYPAAMILGVTTQAILPGNCDPDPEVTLLDYRCLADCLRGPDLGIDAACATLDLDQDGDVDLEDALDFSRRFGS